MNRYSNKPYYFVMYLIMKIFIKSIKLLVTKIHVHLNKWLQLSQTINEAIKITLGKQSHKVN